jgi:hypothetical protein
MMTDEDPYANDAFRQYHDLLDKFTTVTEIRNDIIVHAYAWNRSVELEIFENPQNTAYSSTGKRNVGTMRELAQALNDACDFVEASNPKWTELTNR